MAERISTAIFKNKCAVLINNCTATGHECDLLGVTANGRVIDIEIKISRSDLKADAKKEKWWDRRFIGWIELHGPWKQGQQYRREEAHYKNTRRSHPVKVWKHYYCMPAEIWSDDLLPCLPSEDSGILLLRMIDGKVSVSVRRMAKPSRQATPLTAFEILNIARLATIRLWNAYSKIHLMEKEIAKMRQPK